MANQTVRLWEAALDSLKGLSTASYSDSSGERTRVLLEKIACSPPQAKATWKWLVKDMQLPRKLGLFASSKLGLDPCSTGPLLPVFTEAVRTLLSTAQQDCMPHVQAEIIQQLADSGLIKMLEQLKQATAERMEQGAAAAAAAAAPAAQAAPAAAAAASAAVTAVAAAATAAGGNPALEALQHTAGRLLVLQEQMDSVLNSMPASTSTSSSITAGVHRLLCASLQHISVLLPLYLHQDQQPPPSITLGFLAQNMAVFARKMAVGASATDSKQKLSLSAKAGDNARAGEQHYTAWADISLLLVTYAWTLKLRGCLPAVNISASSNNSSTNGTGSSGGGGRRSTGGSSTGSSAGSSGVAAAAAAVAASFTGDSSSFSPLEAIVLASSGKNAWQRAQRQWQHVPATHKQLIGLFGVSAEAAVYIASILSTDELLPHLEECWRSIPHLSRVAGGAITQAELQQWTEVSVAQQLRPQLQQQQLQPGSLDTELLLVQLRKPLVLYGAVHARADSDARQWTAASGLAASTTVGLHAEHMRLTSEAAAANNSIRSTSAGQPAVGAAGIAGLDVSAAVAAEVLLLTLDLLQQLQRRRKACAAAVATTSSSSQGVAGAAAKARVADAAAAFAEAHKAHDSVAFVLQYAVTYVQAAFDQAEAVAAMQGTLPSGAAAAAGKHMAGSQAADVLGAVWQEQVVAVCTVFEDFVRGADSAGQGLSDSLIAQLVHIASVCQTELERHSHAWGGSSEQQRALFRLLVSLLKRTGDSALDPGARASTVVAQVAGGLLQRSSAAGFESDGQIGPGGLGLLLFGRCCVQWAAALQRLERQGISRVMQQAQHVFESLQRACAPGKAARELVLGLYEEGRELGPRLLRQYAVVGTLGESLAASQGSSWCAQLSAAGYDMDGLVKGVTALTASYSKVLQTLCFSDDTVADRVGGLVRQLVSVGQALSVFAVPYCCNNPRCVNTGGVSEKAVVSGKSCLCAGCKVARYCSKSCQEACWKRVHKPVCKMLRAHSGGAAEA